MATAFLAIGFVGLALLVVSIVFGHFFDGLFDAIDVDLGGHDLVGDGLLSSAAIGTFVTGFGFVGWLSLEAGGAAVWLSLLLALVVALGLAVVVGRLVGSLMRMNTDRTPTRDDMLGRLGVVTTPIPGGGLGQIRIDLAGSPLKLSARSDEAPLARGTKIVVMELLTETAVRVSTEASVLDYPSTTKELE